MSTLFSFFSLYCNTIKYLKFEQVYIRIRKLLKLGCSLDLLPQNEYRKINCYEVPEGLDFDDIFLKRFVPDELYNNEVTFLHRKCVFKWNQEWNIKEETTLWNFNLHYFEYLFSFVDAFRQTNDFKYLEKAFYCIEQWIEKNPYGKGYGWSPYTIALRLNNWLSFFHYVKEYMPDNFERKFLDSIFLQYNFLARNLEKDILGNHYFDDLKTLILCSIFFDDKRYLDVVICEFRKECEEQILSDGMHFELSPMYHKIVFESLIRVVIALKSAGHDVEWFIKYIKSMLDVAFTFEDGLMRLPLFNDCGNNIAKSLGALTRIVNQYFNIQPEKKKILYESGYYFFRSGPYLVIVDAGKVGPDYIPGHAHCDVGSFEVFKNGNPIIVNSGTYAYQCVQRSYFRSTEAHNTVMVDKVEQSECWGDFRVARRSNVEINYKDKTSLELKIVDYLGNIIIRRITVNKDNIVLEDKSQKNIKSFIHVLDDVCNISSNVQCEKTMKPYSPEYGFQQDITCIEFKPSKIIKTIILFGGKNE